MAGPWGRGFACVGSGWNYAGRARIAQMMPAQRNRAFLVCVGSSLTLDPTSGLGTVLIWRNAARSPCQSHGAQKRQQQRSTSMKPTRTWILIADGARARILE